LHGRDGHQLSATTIRVPDTDRVEVLTEVAPANPAEVTVPAEERRLNRYDVTHAQIRHFPTDGDDFPGELVPGNDGVAGAVELTVDHVDVGVTNPAPVAGNDDPLGGGTGIIDAFQPHRPGL